MDDIFLNETNKSDVLLECQRIEQQNKMIQSSSKQYGQSKSSPRGELSVKSSKKPDLNT